MFAEELLIVERVGREAANVDSRYVCNGRPLDHKAIRQKENRLVLIRKSWQIRATTQQRPATSESVGPFFPFGCSASTSDRR